MAKEDQFGRDIKLAGGNVASRILPIKIHDLDPEDRKLYEDQTGGILRGIEFIYKEPGVNRPLSTNDDTKENLNRTQYKNQINKVANAVKEIINALKKPNQQIGEFPKEVIKAKPESSKKLNPKIIIASGIILLMIVLGYFVIPTLSKPKEQLERSIAVLPFFNDSSNDSTAYFIDGVMEEVLSNLQSIKDFRVLSRTSTDQYKGSNKPTIPEIAKKLGVNYIVEGSGQKSGSKFRLRVQLIRASKESHLWAKSYEQENPEAKDYFSIQSQIAQAIATQLEAIITPQEKQLIEKIPTTDLAAYDSYLKGMSYLRKENNNDLKTAFLYFELAIDKDPKFALAYVGISSTWRERIQLGDMQSGEGAPKAMAAIMRAIELDSTSAEVQRSLACLNNRSVRFSAAFLFSKLSGSRS